MTKLNPDKVNVDFQWGVTPKGPIIPRRYTLTHSDVTGELFLTIGIEYDFDKIGPMRDEVLAEWCYINHQYVLYVYCYVGGPFCKEVAAKRYKIFKQELPRALQALYIGDEILFELNPDLLDASVFVTFDSTFPAFNRIENFGTLAEFT